MANVELNLDNRAQLLNLVKRLSADEQMSFVLDVLPFMNANDFSPYIQEQRDIEALLARQVHISPQVLKKLDLLARYLIQKYETQDFSSFIQKAMTNQELIPFERWEVQDIENQFGITQKKELTILDSWLGHQEEIFLEKSQEIKRLQSRLAEGVNFWNEEELKALFIFPLLDLIDYQNVPQYRGYMERKIQAEIAGIRVGGKVDFLIASGKQKPQQPYFCVHEYKREIGGSSDPLGQLLITMYTAQALNQDTSPVYGAYILGRNWFFVVLIEQAYAVSLAYDATKDDIFDIFRALQKVKIYINQRTQA